MTATDRRLTGKAVLPQTGEIREVELFDASPQPGERVEVCTADNSTLEYLTFARIALTGEPQTVTLAGDEEACFFCNEGTAEITVGDETFAVEKDGMLYVGLGETVTLSGTADVSEFRAPQCSTKYPAQLVQLADIEGTDLAFHTGNPDNKTTRTVYKLIDTNVDACRLLFGVTYLEKPGSVGSYPPHFHGPDGEGGLGDDAKEEIYVFRVSSRVPEEQAFVLQNVSRPGEDVNTYVHVFDDQAINVTPSFHDTIAPPTVDFSFTWCLASVQEGARDWAAILKRPGYENES